MAFNAIVDETIDQWSNHSEVFLTRLFSGKDEHIRTLTTLIKDGRLANGKGDGTASPSPAHANEEAAARAFYAVAIPAVWTLTGQAPAVIDAGKCKGHDAIPKIVANGEMTYSCYKDRAYFLVAAPNGSKGTKCVAPIVNTIERCTTKAMGRPPGLQELDGKAWGTVEHHDLIAG